MKAHSPTFAFTVRELTGKQIDIATLSAHHTVADLMQAIAAATGGDGNLRLVFKKLPLDDESQTLGRVGIREGSEVVAVAKLQDHTNSLLPVPAPSPAPALQRQSSGLMGWYAADGTWVERSQAEASPKSAEDMLANFNRFDKDGSGKLDKHELKALLEFQMGVDFSVPQSGGRGRGRGRGRGGGRGGGRAGGGRGALRDADVMDIIHGIDLDKDGKVDFEEFKLLVGYSPPLAAAEPEQDQFWEARDDWEQEDPALLPASARP